MSILRSYFSKNNTITSNSYVNTGRNPVIQLNFGASDYLVPNYGYTRFIFDLDLSLLEEMIDTGTISTGCTSAMTHTLKMTNTSSFDNELLNTTMSDTRRRATSFDLILFRIPKISGSTGLPQEWDEGVGYDYNDFNIAQNSAQGNEDLNMDMTNEVNGILQGTITGVTGWGLAYLPQIENITGLTDSYSVAFFSRHTQTFYQPYLLTNYDDFIQDDRNQFLKNQENKLYLYIYQNGDFVNLDSDPVVRIEDRNGVAVSGMATLQTCLRTKGIYEVIVPNGFTGPTPCQYYDVWSGLTINGQSLPNVTNTFTLQQYTAGIQIGSLSKEPQKFGFNFYGILQNEQILSTDIRKVGVTIKKAYTGQQMLLDVSAFYRVYVKEGTTEVQVQDWTPINRTPNEYYFIFDMRDKIPNQYYVDIQVNTSGEKDTYKKQLTFSIVNVK